MFVYLCPYGHEEWFWKATTIFAKIPKTKFLLFSKIGLGARTI